VFILVDHFLFVLGLLAPQHEDDAFAFLVNLPDDMVGELLPAFFLVRVRFALLHCEDSVE
jgi:hypothetical protein